MRGSLANMIICGICLNLMGCFSARHCSDKIALECTDFSENVSSALCSSAFTPGCGPSECWWQMFGDAQLDRLMEIGLACNPDIKVAQARINLAYQSALESRSALLPYFDLFGSYSRQKNSLYDVGIPAFVPLVEGDNLYYNTATTLLRATYEVDVWGKNRNNYYASLGLLQAQIADKAQAKLILSASIAEGYFNLQNHLVQLALLKEQIDAKKWAYKLLHERFYRGIDDEFFVYIFDSEIATLEDNYAKLEGVIDVDKHTLAALVGNVAAGGEICCDMVARYDVPVELPSCLPIDFLARRPDIMASLWTIQSRGYDIKVAKARFFPSLDLAGDIGSIAFLVSKFFSDPAIAILGEAMSTLPLYTGGQLPAKLGQAQAGIEIAVEQYNQTLLTAIKDVEDALTNLRANDKRLTQIKEAVKDSQSLYNLTNQKYEHGIESNVRALNARASLYSQKVLESQIQLDRMNSIVEVIRSIGGGYRGC